MSGKRFFAVVLEDDNEDENKGEGRNAEPELAEKERVEKTQHDRCEDSLRGFLTQASLRYYSFPEFGQGFLLEGTKQHRKAEDGDHQPDKTRDNAGRRIDALIPVGHGGHLDG